VRSLHRCARLRLAKRGLRLPFFPRCAATSQRFRLATLLIAGELTQKTGDIDLQVLTPGADLASYPAHIRQAPHRVLMLDYDGTLAPFHLRPDCAVPYPGVTALLQRIMEAGGTRVVIVSGRPARELPPLLAPERLPEIWGAHGWERLLPDGTLHVEEPHAIARAALTEAARAVRAIMPPEARLEEKLASIALHWRGLPADVAAQLRADATAAWDAAADGKGGVVELLPFEAGLELRALGFSKAHAVQAILGESASDSVVAYLGDDITDEDAFRAVRPRGMAVLVRSELRDTAADLWITPPAELLEFLEYWHVRRS
jgi:trehalose 6-phosphate phosphatase